MIRSTFIMAMAAIASAIAIQPATAQTAASYVAPVVVAPAPPPLPPPVTRALLPGHWQLDGALYVWVKPETRLRVVQERALILGQNVWNDGSWVFVPAHYARPH